jgi:hypothetical protein
VVERASDQFQDTPERVAGYAVDPVFGGEARKLARAAAGAFNVAIQDGQKRTGARHSQVAVLTPVDCAEEEPLEKISLLSDDGAATAGTTDHVFFDP